jgi:hypothetical protein|tara:strand:+ start:322 stop:588 length:267 start_codon:yes stop_codon:yes gene_type:complete
MIVFEIMVLVVTVVSLWVNYKLFNRLMFVNDNYDNVMSSIEVFREHLNQLNNSEIYVGEPTIEKLILHSKDVIDDIESFLAGFSDEEQ